MSFNGGGGHSRSGSIGRNGAHTKDASDTYSNGIQVIDENKEFAYVI